MRHLIAGLVASAIAVVAVPAGLLMASPYMGNVILAQANACKTQTIDEVKAKLPPTAKVIEIPERFIAPVLAQFGASIPAGASRMFFVQVGEKGLIAMTDAVGCNVAVAGGSAKAFYAALEKVTGKVS